MRHVFCSMRVIVLDKYFLSIICNDFLADQFKHVNMCFGCSKEPSHRDGSFEDPQHMFGW